jgi:hypothetical protein
MANAQAALDSAIAEAETQILAETETKSDEPVEESTDESNEGAESDDEPQADPDELSAEEIKEAQVLYKSLKNPSLRGPIVAALAEQSGILNRPLETAKQVTRAEKGIAELIDDALPEYPGLSKKLGPVIEQIVEAERLQRNAEMETVQQQNVERDVVTELDSLARETKGDSRKVETRMKEIMNDVQPGPNVTIKSYLRTLYTLATASGTQKKVSTEIADKIRRNANNAPDRLKTSPGTARTSTLPDKKMNLNDSVNWAINQAFKNGK